MHLGYPLLLFLGRQQGVALKVEQPGPEPLHLRDAAVTVSLLFTCSTQRQALAMPCLRRALPGLCTSL